MSAIGKSVKRQDGLFKVTGRTKYIDDIHVPNMLHAKVFRSPVANGRCTAINVEEARKLAGVVAVFTFADVPQLPFPTAGHPYSLDPHHQDIADRLILNDRVRYVGDDVAVVVAVDEFIAERAVDLITAEFEEYQPLLSPQESLDSSAEIHEGTNNCFAKWDYTVGDRDNASKDVAHTFSAEFHVPIVQHCAMENHSAYAYIDTNGKIVVVSSTQIPYICRRVVGQALGISWGKVRIIKPYVGGGFGAKQDVVLEPLVAFLTSRLNGRPVRLQYTREETFVSSRVRHAMDMKLHTGVSADGILKLREFEVLSKNGAYASHGQSICSKTMATYCMLYAPQPDCFLSASGKTLYTNTPAAGAMRGYGAPQSIFAVESHIEDIARAIGMDSIELRLRNLTRVGWINPLNGVEVRSNGLRDCIEKGRKLVSWDAKKMQYRNQTGDKRRGLGMACFAYYTGVHPISIEIEGCRIMMNDDGSMQLQIGATEIGQGSDTVFAQMVAETVGVPFETVYVVSEQDTDVTPVGLGSYASRQSFSTGLAVRKAAELLREQVLKYAVENFKVAAETADICDGWIVSNDAQVVSLADISLHSCCNKPTAAPFSVDITNNAMDNPTAYGVTFAEIEVDIPLGKVEIKEIWNVHDSGKILNPQLAEGQVHGGMSMGIGFGLYEQLLIDAKGHPLNENLLDYKLMTMPDTPELNAAFVETYDPCAPYGNKALGEPPVCSPAAALRNAILDATGVGFNSLPITPQKMIEAFTAAGLISVKDGI
ncbi:MAG: xanthine dehydrogenase subunit XdhA [Negativicutes bacterium]|jgi:xanthine dehydrogenase molybdenum-binding subunit